MYAHVSCKHISHFNDCFPNSFLLSQTIPPHPSSPQPPNHSIAFLDILTTMSATVSISSTLTMRPMDLWHCYKTASPCVPEPRPWPTPEPAPASASCNQTNAPAQALSPIHDGGVGVWKVQVALSRLEFKLALAGKAKTGGYMRSLELSKDKNVRPGEHLKRSTNKATARYTASMALDGIWEEEATPSKHDDTRPSMGAEAAQSEQSTAEAVCREDKMSYSKVDDKEESSRSAGKRVMTDTGSQDRDSRPLASLETRLQRIGKKCTKAEMQIARAKSFMVRTTPRIQNATATSPIPNTTVSSPATFSVP